MHNITKGDNAKSKKVRVVIFVRDTSSRPVLHFYQVPSNYSEGYSSYWADTKSISNKTKGNNFKIKKARVVILVKDTSFHPVIYFYQVQSKYSKGYFSYRADVKSIQTKRREITPEVRKPELSFLYATRHLILFYISTKYHKIFQKVFVLQSGHEINAYSLSNITKGDNAKSKKDRVVILVRDTSSCPVLYFIQVPSKYSEGYSSYRENTKSISNKTKVELSFLYSTRRLVLFYISTKYHQNIPKGIQVQSGQVLRRRRRWRRHRHRRQRDPSKKTKQQQKTIRPPPFGSGEEA